MNRFKTNNRIGYKILSAVTAIGMSLSLAPVVHAEDAKKVVTFADDYTATYSVANGTAEDAIGLPAKLDATIDDSEETVELDVSWTANPEYSATTAGDYAFTSAMGDEYVLADGASMPIVTVTVNPKTDENTSSEAEKTDAQNVQDKIDALPDATAVDFAVTADNVDDLTAQYEAVSDAIDAFTSNDGVTTELDLTKYDALFTALDDFSKLAESVTYEVQGNEIQGNQETETTTDWQIDKSKTATELDANNQTTVTLSLPSADYTAVNADIVFVIDKSGYANADSVTAAYEQMFSTLIDLQNENPNSTIKVGVIRFDAWGVDAIDWDNTEEKYKGLLELNDENKDVIKASMSKEGNAARIMQGGTNTEQPIRLANSMLAEDTTPNTEKYVVMISDYSGYMYEGSATINGKTYDNIPVGSANSNSPTDSNARVSIYEGKGTAYNNWDDLYQAYTDGSLKTSDWGKDEVLFGYGYSFYAYLQSAWTNYNPDSWDTVTYAQYVQTAKDLRTATKDLAHVSGIQRSELLTYDAIQQSLTAGNHFISYRVTDGNPDFTNNIYATGMLDQIAEKGSENYSEADGDSLADVFNGLTKRIVYLLGSGTVTDAIGSDFSLVKNANECPFTLTIGGEKQTVVSTADNEWSFGTAVNGVYPYVVNYTPGTDENFVWTINVPVEKSKQAKLSYDLQLENSALGTYETNGETKLEYLDSNGITHDPEYFTSPTVTKKGSVTPTPSTPTPTPTTNPETKPNQFLVTFLDCNGNTVKVEWVAYQGSATAPVGFGSYTGYSNVSANMDLRPTSCSVNNSWVVPNTADKY